jgi:hypothetical protein
MLQKYIKTFAKTPLPQPQNKVAMFPCVHVPLFSYGHFIIKLLLYAPSPSAEDPNMSRVLITLKLIVSSLGIDDGNLVLHFVGMGKNKLAVRQEPLQNTLPLGHETANRREGKQWQSLFHMSGFFIYRCGCLS